jgi:hypothetical protein
MPSCPALNRVSPPRRVSPKFLISRPASPRTILQTCLAPLPIATDNWFDPLIRGPQRSQIAFAGGKDFSIPNSSVAVTLDLAKRQKRGANRIAPCRVTSAAVRQYCRHACLLLQSDDIYSVYYPVYYPVGVPNRSHRCGSAPNRVSNTYRLIACTYCLSPPSTCRLERVRGDTSRSFASLGGKLPLRALS